MIVDYGLCVEVVVEVDYICKVCVKLGIFYVMVCWMGWGGEGNL